jgi:hypothetical protein
MNWKNRLQTELTNLGQLGVGAGGDRLSIDVPVGRIECAIASVDAIGCSFDEIALVTKRLEDHSTDQLKQVSEKLSQQIRYLLEPISPIETDPEGATVQMRSNPPQRDDDGTKYYELLVRRDGLSLRRFARGKGQPRQSVSAHVTREVLVRVASDFVEAVS